MVTLASSNITTTIILVVIVAAVIIFAVVTAITGRKNQKLEREKRKKSVKQKIKKFLRDNYNVKNSRIEYEKVVARKGKSYKYRDIFDVLIDVYEPKSSVLVFSKAFEIEGLSHKVDKKTVETEWVINGELDYDQTKRNIQIVEGTIKLSKEELADRKAKAKKEKKATDGEKSKAVKGKPVQHRTEKFNPRG